MEGPLYHFVNKSSQYCMHGIPFFVVLFVFIQELHQSSHTGCACTDEIFAAFNRLANVVEVQNSRFSKSPPKDYTGISRCSYPP